MKRPTLALFGLAAGLALGFLALLTPPPAPADSPGFSATRARKDILRIAAEPHTVWEQDKLDPVRDFIRESLRASGLEPRTMTYPPLTDRWGHSYPLANIAADIPGKSGRYLLIAAHYDSSPKKRSAEQGGSRGAADDGYGVATMLEIARLLAPRAGSLENGVRLLFTDGEELGMLGAEAEMRENRAAYADVGFVINLEARGVKGPLVLFETGPRNRAAIEFFRKARWPFGYSFAVDVYRNLPNGTDFTMFLDAGLTGLNFSVLDDLSYYHTPRDNPDNISLTSLQHYGEQVLPLVEAWIADPRFADPAAFAAEEDMVYFTWLPGILVAYPAGFAAALGIAALILFLAWMALSLRRREARLGASLLWFLAWLGLTAAALGLGLGLSVLLGRLTGIAWKVTYMPGVPLERPLTWAFIAAFALIPWIVAAGRARRGKETASLLAGAFLLNLLALGLIHRYLPGASFMFALPLLAGLGGRLLAERTGQAWIAAIPAALTIGLYLPILHLLGLALTIGALGVIALTAFPALTLAGCLLAGGGASTRAGQAAPGA